jgi:hypothetical protein
MATTKKTTTTKKAPVKKAVVQKPPTDDFVRIIDELRVQIETAQKQLVMLAGASVAVILLITAGLLVL